MEFDEKTTQFLIVCIFGALLVLALIIDGEFGERAFGVLMASFGMVLGYFFRKAQDSKQSPTYIFEENKKN